MNLNAKVSKYIRSWKKCVVVCTGKKNKKLRITVKLQKEASVNEKKSVDLSAKGQGFFARREC